MHKQAQKVSPSLLWEDNSPWVSPPVWLSWLGRWSSLLMTFPGSWLHLWTPSQEAALESSCSGAPSPSDLRSDRSLNLQEIEMTSQNYRKTERTLLWASQTQWLPQHCQDSGIQHTKETVAEKNNQEYKYVLCKVVANRVTQICCSRHKRWLRHTATCTLFIPLPLMYFWKTQLRPYVFASKS